MTDEEDKEIKAHVSFGNSKLPKTTMIFNMGATVDCPSDALGLCHFNSKICYAKAAERQYHKICPQYRKRQENIWQKYSAIQLAKAFVKIIKSKRIKVDAFRFNESGDFWSQECVKKLSVIAAWLKIEDILTYGYTARKDLDFSKVCFFVLGSNFLLDGEFRTVTRPSGLHSVCPGDCKVCTLCQGYDGVIEVIVH
ncbi:MAG: hypothetical protein E3J41_00555 [Candidatus Cloacimonadota bacterium]|nr:MAG: hypothetical protein E3J41_00555 [Candidatus Cloacimonadota bacterium]